VSDPCRCFNGWLIPSCPATIHIDQVTPSVPIEATRHPCRCITWVAKEKQLNKQIQVLIIMPCNLGYDVCKNATAAIAANPGMPVRVSKPRKVPVVA